MAVRLEFLKTSEGVDGHTHIVAVNFESGSGVASVFADHTHEVAFSEEDIQLGLAPDGHTHELYDYPVKIKRKKKGDDAKTLGSVYGQYMAWEENEQGSIEDARKCEKMYRGDQWESTGKQSLEAQDRAALTINVVEKQVDILSGHQRVMRSDIVFTPVEGSDQVAADMYTECVKNILAQCFYEREESKAFEDSVITGRGLLNIRIDKSKDLDGDIIVERFPWDHVRFAPHEKEDLSDCEGIIKERWYSLNKLKQLYPEHAKKLDGDITARAELKDIAPEVHTNYEYDQYRESGDWKAAPSVIGDTVLVDTLRREYRVLERWLRSYHKVSVVFDVETDFYYSLEGWEKSDVRAVKQMGFAVMDRVLERMRLTRVAGAVILTDEDPVDLPADDFFVVPVYAKKRGNRFWGKVKSILDPQIEINKRHSQTIDIGNKMCAYLYYYDDGVFPPGEEEYFRNNSSRPGALVKVNSLERRPIKEEGIKFPAELVELMSIEHNFVNELMNIQSDASVGANTSGSAMLQRERAKLTSNQYLFDNLSFAKTKLGRLLLKTIQKEWSPDKIYRLVAGRAAKEDVQIAGQEFSEWTYEDIVGVLDDQDIVKYDVVVAESDYTPTTRMATFIILSELASKGLPIPPDVLIELADFPAHHKQRILDGLRQQMGAEESDADKKKMMEENKTLITQGIIPPDVQERLSGGMQQDMQGGSEELPLDPAFLGA